MEIINKHLSKHITKSPNRQISYIVIHYTAGGSSKPGRAQNVYNVFIQNAASADFAIDDKEVVQLNPDIRNFYCWHCGGSLVKSISGGKFKGKCMNKNSIGIEVCSNIKAGYDITKANHMGWYYTQETLANVEKLVKYLMKTYNIDKENVLRHYDVTGKLCPACAGWVPENGGETEWIKFKEKLK